jgi:hypothetical protein
MMDLASAQGAYLTKDIAGIRCRKNPAGKWVPTASAALDLLFPDQGQWIHQADLDRGTRCHAWMEQWLKWVYDPNAYAHPDDLKEKTEQARVMIASNLFRSLGDARIIGVENSLFSKDGSWSATPDVDFLLRRQHIGIDWKFAEHLDVRYDVQAEADRHLVPKMDAVWLVQINAKGEVRVVKTKHNPHYWMAFSSAIGVLKWRLRNS